MTSSLLHRLRRNRRGIASAALALFVLNWLGMALAPCAMAFAPAASFAAVEAPCPHCPEADDPSPPCHDESGTRAVSPSVCEFVPKPAIDARDLKASDESLVLALAAPVLLVLEPLAAPAVAPVDRAAPRPEKPPFDRYGRRLE